MSAHSLFSLLQQSDILAPKLVELLLRRIVIFLIVPRVHQSLDFPLDLIRTGYSPFIVSVGQDLIIRLCAFLFQQDVPDATLLGLLQDVTALDSLLVHQFPSILILGFLLVLN